MGYRSVRDVTHMAEPPAVHGLHAECHEAVEAVRPCFHRSSRAQAGRCHSIGSPRDTRTRVNPSERLYFSGASLSPTRKQFATGPAFAGAANEVGITGAHRCVQFGETCFALRS
jgi:hypothetical protein